MAGVSVLGVILHIQHYTNDITLSPNILWREDKKDDTTASVSSFRTLTFLSP